MIEYDFQEIAIIDGPFSTLAHIVISHNCDILDSSFPLLIFFALSWKWLYESPLWSVKKSKTADAVKNLTAIRGPNYDVTYLDIAD